MLRTIFFVFTSILVLILGFPVDDPCYLIPKIRGIPKDKDFTVDVRVPDGCNNGTFHWNYPRGHVMLKFSNKQSAQKSICIKNSIVGDVLNITDIPSGRHLEGFTHKNWACTQPSDTHEIVLQIDAPKDMSYMAAVLYGIRQ